MPQPTKAQPSKSDFIRQNPTLSPVELIAKGKAQGITFSRRLVSKVRESAPEKAAPAATAAAKPPAQPAAPKAPATAPPQPAAPKAPDVKAPPQPAAKKAPAKKATPRPAKKPAAARGPKPKGAISASDFVRSMPSSMTPNEVVAKGAAQGFKFSRNLVYMVRAKAAAKKQPVRRGPGRPAVKALVTAPVKAAAPASAVSTEHVLAQLIIEHGLGRVREMLGAAEERVMKILRGG